MGAQDLPGEEAWLIGERRRRARPAPGAILSAKSVCRLMLLEAAHTSDASFDPAMVLFKPIV